MKFYRYEAREYAQLDQFGDFISSKFPNPKIVFIEYNLYKETNKGYWIGFGSFYEGSSLRSNAKWIPKTSKKRFAYPTKEEAINNFIKRTEKRISILSNQLDSAKIAVINAKSVQNELKIKL